MTTNEMLRLQGMDPQQLDLTGVDDHDLGKMVGNSMAVNVLERILSPALIAAGFPVAGGGRLAFLRRNQLRADAVRKRKRDDESPA